MFQLRRRGQVAYEDLMRELEMIEHQIMSVDPSLAMNLMALDAKIRGRFQLMERAAGYAPEESASLPDMLAADDMRALIPHDLPTFPTFEEIEAPVRKNRWETAGMAAALAIVSALGVFGLASVLQMALTWLA